MTNHTLFFSLPPFPEGQLLNKWNLVQNEQQEYLEGNKSHTKNLSQDLDEAAEFSSHT